MASGDTLYVWEATAGIPPDTGVTTDVPQFGLRGGFVHAAFDDATDETLDFHGIMPSSYAATTGVTVRLYWAATNDAAAGNTVTWRAHWRQITLDSDDIDAAGGAASNTAASAESTAGTGSGALIATSIPFTAGGQMDSVAAGEMFVLSIDRNAGADTLVGDAELYKVELEET